MGSPEFGERFGGLERQVERDMAAHYAIPPGLQGRRDLERGVGHPRRVAGYRLRPAGAVLCGGRGQDLRQFCGGQKAGTRIKAVRPLCAGKGPYHLWHGADAGPVEYHPGRGVLHYERGGLRSAIVHRPARRDRDGH